MKNSIPSIWYDVIDASMLMFIRQVNNNPPLSVFVRNPDQDFSNVKYPCISIFAIQEMFSKDRYDNRFTTTIRRDEEKSLSVKKQSSLPYYLMYQVEFWSYYRAEINGIMQRWREATGRNFMLPLYLTEKHEIVLDENKKPIPLVVEDFGKEKHLKCKIDEVSSVILDEQDMINRVSHRAITYRIWADIELSLQEVKVVTKVITNKVSMIDKGDRSHE